MAASVVVEVGPARSGKTYRLLDRYRSTLRGSGMPVRRALWIAPTARAATAVREQLLFDEMEACLGPGVTTFDDLTNAILSESRVNLWPVDACAMRALVRRVLQQAHKAGRLDRFAAAAHSAGFVDIVVEHFKELKRRGIEPGAFAAAPSRRARDEEHQVLGQLYTDYQLLLHEHALADREGGHWIARDQLAAGGCPSLTHLALVVVDGFTDFTPTQHDVLRLLAGRSDELLISLPADGDDLDASRDDLFAKTVFTLEELRRNHPSMKVRPHPPRPSTWPAIDFIAANLFGNPRAVTTPAANVQQSLDRIEIVAAAGQHDEMVQIARRVKQRLASQQTRPAEIVVVFRSLHHAAPRVREVFSEFGIPFTIESAERLLHAPLVKTLLGLLRLAEEDWPYRRVIAVVTNNLLTAIDDPSRQSADWLVRDLQIAAGRDALLRRMESLAESAADRDTSEDHQRRAAVARVALPALRGMAQALDDLPAAATLDDWSTALDKLCTRLGFRPLFDAAALSNTGDKGVHDASEETRATIDSQAWQTIARQFKSLARLDARLDEPSTVYSRSDLLRLLLDVAMHESLRQLNDDTGRVRVLGAATARTVTATHLYLAGMSEQAFPLPESAGRLYSEDDYRALQRVAQQRSTASKKKATSSAAASIGRAQEEMLLFYEVLTRAQESITISYPALDDKAQAIPPSPYVTEIERLFEKSPVKPSRTAPELTPIPKNGMPYSPGEWRVLAVDQALAGEPALLAEFCTVQQMATAAASIDAGLRIVRARARGEFGAAEGILNSPAVVERLARRFGPLHRWSTSQWERYASCPYKFFLSDVLKLEPLGELTLETDFGRRGGLLHDVLARFYREWNARPKEFAHDQARFTEALLNVLAEEVAAARRFGIEAALLELDRRQIAKWAEKHYEQWTAYAASFAHMDQPLTPAHFELRFGPSRAGEAAADDPDSTSDDFELELDGEMVRVAGRIDRIDVGREGDRTFFSVIDYKTGKTTSLKAEHIASGERLQLPIYVAAAQAILFDNQATPVAAGYWTMDRGFDQRGALNVKQERAKQERGDDDGGQNMDDLQRLAKVRIKQFVTDIRAGDFPVFSRDEHCTGRCQFNTVCRVAQVRAIGKPWPPE